MQPPAATSFRATGLGFDTVTTDGSGNASINSTLIGVSVTAGHVVSATATLDLGAGNHGETSEFAANVMATAGNQPPVINFGEGNKAFIENGAALIIDTTATTSDLDSPDFDTGHLVVDISANGSAEDRLSIVHEGTGAGQIGVSGANVSFGGVTIATFAGGTDGSTPLDITFNASADAGAVQALMRRIAYEAVGEDPSTLTRTVRFTLSDGDGATSTPISKDITITGDSDLWVTTTDDTADGDTSSVQALLADRGADGRISLREAIIATNNTVGANQIHFDIPEALVGGAHTIRPTSALPTLSDTVFIDATTEPDFIGTPVVEIDGSLAGSATGLVIGTGASGSTIRGLAINRFASNGIQFSSGVDNVTIVGNHIGTDVTGTIALGNGASGILLSNTANSQIGGATAADRNVIADNGSNGIRIIGGSSGNAIQGNLIGIGTNGAALGNTTTNILFGTGGPNNNLVGGTAPGEGNTIANSTGSGIGMSSSAGSGNAFLGNLIHDNTTHGISMAGTPGNDAEDADSGPNDLLNFPVLVDVVQNGADLDLSFALDVPAGDYRIEFFGNPGGVDPLWLGEGEVLLGAASVSTTGAAGYETFTRTLIGVAPSQLAGISATLTQDLGGGNYGSTSEFGTSFAGAGVLVVNTTDDVSDGDTSSITALLGNRGADELISLREAITAANNTVNGASPDEIRFDIPDALVGGAHTIQLASGLPAITDAVVIDASSDPDFVGTPIVVLDGSLTGGAHGLHLQADDSTIRGLVIGNFGISGIVIDGGSNNAIVGNYVGTDVTGLVAAPNVSHGISIIAGANNTIGGTGAQDGNVVSGNGASGIVLNLGATGNFVQGNLIGLGADGTTTLGNTTFGVTIGPGGASPGNTIGGSVAGARNIISGNGATGVRIGLGDGNTVLGNYIGTDASGSASRPNLDGIQVYSANNTIGGTGALEGNLVSGNTSTGIVISGASASGNQVLGNFVGTNAAGSLALGNGDNGISIGAGAAGNTIGGTAAGSRNLVSGNTGGIDISGAGTDGNVVSGNWVGTDAAGTGAIANSNVGIAVSAGADGTVVGGATAAHRNVVAGASIDAIRLNAVTNTSILSNYIGTDATGTVDLGAAQEGIEVVSSTGTVIGQAGAGNLISGNDGGGIGLQTGASATTIQGNLIGTAADGTTALGNVGHPVYITGAGSDNNLIGGINAGEGNTLANGTGDGVSLWADAGTGNAILGNLFLDNAGLGIDLSNDGVSANDATDVDAGPNTLLNFPVLVSAEISGTDLSVRTTLSQALPNTLLRIEFYNSPLGTEDASGHGEGRQFLGASNILTDGSGNADVVIVLNGVSVAADDRVSATATRDLGGGNYGDTSEFALNVVATAANQDPVIAFGEGDKAYTENGAAIIIDASATVSDADSADFDGGHLLVDVPTNGDAYDRIEIRNEGMGAGQVGVSGNQVYYGGSLIGTFSGSGAPLDVSFNATADATAVQSVMRNITFRNLSQDPSVLTRVVRFALSDGDGGNSLAIAKNITIAADSDLWVTTTADTADGDTSSVQALLADRGADGRISLREAIIATNNTAGANEIYFDIPDALVGGAHTIQPSSALPVITDTVVIDGSSEPDFSGTPIVRLNGTGGPPKTGLALGAGSDGSTIRALAIVNFANGGIQISGSGSNLVAGNYVGLDVDGSTVAGNGSAGIAITGAAGGNVIGGSTATDRNVISGNQTGVLLNGAAVTSNSVTGNFIGTDASGDLDRGNTTDGIEISGGAHDNVVGGALAAQRNVIAGNDNDGVWITDAGTDATIVIGNWIGVGASGGALQNSFHGVAIENGAAGARIGGTGPGDGNRIENSAWDGVSISGAGTGNAVLGNSIQASGDLGIDLGNDGVTANDAGDADSGANDLQNMPVLQAAGTSAGDTRIIGSLNGAASTTFRIEFFSSAAADPSGFGEGAVYLGSTTVVTDGTGNASFDVTLVAVSVPEGDWVTATATVDLGGGLFGSSSEFAANVVAGGLAPSIDLDANDSAAGGLDFATTWIEGDGPVLIADTDALLTDVDSTNLQSLTVTLTNPFDGVDESLTADTSGTSISANYDSGTGVLSLTGADTVANYQQVLRTVSYDNASLAPETTSRIVSFVASDGISDIRARPRPSRSRQSTMPQR
ncbi:MAG: hypothetical protein R3E48_16775 [Burkholderiaceae bacterium]